jgi:hypothetical protein
MAAGVRSVPARIVAVMALALLGCGESTPPKADANELAKQKVAAMKRLAEVLAQDPNGPNVFEALEGFRNIGIDPAQHPAEAQEILDIYKREIEGKYRGENYEQVRLEMFAFKTAAGLK